ncbi:MAG: dipeptidase [Thermoproteota archaeon]|nr:dipeptidase [Thermoproteota archaeon]
MITPKPVYLLAGGRQSLRETTSSLYRRVFEGTGVISPKVAYIGTANQDDESFFHRTSELLRIAGAAKVDHAFIAPKHADVEKAKKILTSADSVFVSGGDVFEGIRVLKEKNMIDFLMSLYESGKPFFGISAGSIMLAEKWVYWRDPNDDSTAELFPCLGLAPIICDTHGEEDGWEELQKALELSDEKQKGYGIVSGTAIKVFSDGKVEGLGGIINQFIRDKEKVTRLSDIIPLI